MFIKLRIESNGVVHAVAVLHQTRQNIFQIFNRERIIRREMFNRPFRPITVTIPDLFDFIALTAK